MLYGLWQLIGRLHDAVVGPTGRPAYRPLSEKTQT